MILVLGGTHEGREVSELLTTMKLPFILSVSSDLGRLTYKDLGCPIVVAPFEDVSMASWIKSHRIKVVIDATHPHALEIKKLAKHACMNTQITYLRFAREISKLPDNSVDSNVHSFKALFDIISSLKLNEEPNMRILITGTKHISDFYNVFSKDQCFFRVMPSVYAMQLCENFGVPTDHIIAIKAPCPVDLNRALFEAYNITHFVFKNSGQGSAFISNLEALKGTDVQGCILEASIDEGAISAQIISDTKTLQLILEEIA